MANYKIVDADQLDADLETVADAIRTKGETTESLAFPAGFVTAISEISSAATAKVATGEIALNYYYDEYDDIIMEDQTVTVGFKPDLVAIYVPESASTRYAQWTASFAEESGGKIAVEINCEMYVNSLFKLTVTRTDKGFGLNFMDISNYVAAYDIDPLRYYAVKYT